MVNYACAFSQSELGKRVHKCSTFGIRKLCTKSVQYLPKMLINGVLIPCVEMGESFRYLGRFFNFDMCNNQHV